MQLICVLGRQPELGLAELESKLGSKAIRPISDQIIQLETDAGPDMFDQLGGTIKAAKFLSYIETTDWNKAIREVQKYLPGLLQQIPEGKVTLGISVYNFNAQSRQINAAALSLKKIIKSSGRSARIVPNKEPELNTAQIIHNNLTSENGIELLLIKNNNRIILARTGWVQDIEAYRMRDQERPKRDARVGMLPPKLAQIIITLSGKHVLPDNVIEHPDNNPKQSVLLDPFCGTGVLLQEALLKGYSVVGTDLEPRMVEYSKDNLKWLQQLTGKDDFPVNLEVADATTHTWNNKFNLIACETYLGRPFSYQPDPETLNKVIHDCNIIHKKFLQNVARQTTAGFRMCIAVPAWSTKNGFKHLPVLDQLKDLGYNRVSFVHVDTEDLVYHRENQVVARELVVLVRS